MANFSLATNAFTKWRAKPCFPIFFYGQSYFWSKRAMASSVYVRLLGYGPELAQINLQIASIKHYNISINEV